MSIKCLICGTESDELSKDTYCIRCHNAAVGVLEAGVKQLRITLEDLLYVVDSIVESYPESVAGRQVDKIEEARKVVKQGEE